MLFGMVRTKAAAIMIGSAGIGLLSNFTIIQTLISTVSGLGIQSSAVRDIANAEATGQRKSIARSALALYRLCWLTGLAGSIAMLSFSSLFSAWVFGSENYAEAIAVLGITILLNSLSGGLLAVIQGMQRIGDLARVNVLSAGTSSFLTIGLYAWLGLRGIVPALMLIAIVQVAFSWFFAKRLFLPRVTVTWSESMSESKSMIALGISFMWSALMVSIVGFATNSLITHYIGLKGVGIYSAAFALSGMFVNFVLNAMGTDYYPRLTKTAPDKDEMNRLVNEQTEIGILLATPGILATISLAPWIIHFFYSAEFLPAAALLQWFILGCLIRVIQWPMGFLQLALAKGKLFFLTQTAFNMLHLVLIWLGIKLIGINGVAVAFFLLYTFSLGVIKSVAKHLTDFQWSNQSRKLIMIAVPVVAATFTMAQFLPLWLATISGMAITAAATALCLRALISRIGKEHRVVRAACKIPGIRMICGL